MSLNCQAPVAAANANQLPCQLISMMIRPKIGQDGLDYRDKLELVA